MRRHATLLALTLTLTPILSGGLASAASAAAEPAAHSRTAPVAVGDVAPDFTLQDQDGHAVALSAARGQRPVVLVFYRGYW